MTAFWVMLGRLLGKGGGYQGFERVRAAPPELVTRPLVATALSDATARSWQVPDSSTATRDHTRPTVVTVGKGGGRVVGGWLCVGEDV
jgi:hypothetical protein